MSGKTSTALQAPNSLLAACEPGYKAIPNVLAFDVTDWTSMLSLASQLKKPEAKERFDTIVIDTLDELVFYAEEFVLNKHGVSKLNDIPWGAGHVEISQMFRRLFHGIVKDYGLIVIAHADLKIDPEDEDRRYATLGFNKKVKKIVMGMLDILGYVEASRLPDTPNLLHFQSSEHWEAKCRFAGMSPTIEFSYQNIVDAIQDAIGDYATATVHKDYYHEDPESKASEEELNSLKQELTELGRDKMETAGPQPVLDLIQNTLAKKIADCTLRDYEGLLVLKEELSRM